MNIGSSIANFWRSPISTSVGFTPLLIDFVQYLTSGNFSPQAALDWHTWVSHAVIAALGSIMHDWKPSDHPPVKGP
jgi:hypothetical protein